MRDRLALEEDRAGRRGTGRDAPPLYDANARPAPRLLRVLLVEDSPDDAELLFRELARASFAPRTRRVETLEGLESALAEKAWDVVISDYKLPRFAGLAALEVVRRRAEDVPFILVSGTIGEDVAVEAMKAGAHDYVMKSNLTRLPLAVARALRDAEERAARRKAESALKILSKAIETMPLGVTIADTEGKILFVNPAEAAMHGYPATELLGQDSRIFSPGPLETAAMTPQLMKAMTTWTRERVNVGKDGRRLPVQLVSTLVKDDGGDPLALVTVCEDISARKHAEAALRDSEERYALAARGANDGLWDWNLRTREIFLSSRFKLMLGYAEDELPSTSEAWLERVHPDDRARFERDIASHLEAFSPHLQAEMRMLHRDGSILWMLCRGMAVRDATGKPYRMAGSLTDVTERKQAEEQLRHDAFYDSLTDLPNRALFLNRLEGVLAHAARSRDRRFAVLFLDLDRFKNVNDSLGHGLGDELLVAIARRLEECLRPGDTVARLGGDEFGILLDEIDGVETATEVADRILKRLRVPFVVKGHEVFSSASIGIACGAERDENADDILRDADTAMYHAKSRGKARFQVFDAAMHSRVVSVLKLENDLRRAVERQEFLVEYQPIVSLRSGRLVAFEALARWNHPERGLVYPEDFIAMTEETGLILPIGRQVLREACRQRASWRDVFGARETLLVTVNLSARQLAQADLVEEIDLILEETGVDARLLGLEITESAIMESTEAATALLRKIKSRKIKLHIDDFGTGYSSLSYLHRFPIDTLKIDRSFVARLGANAKGWRDQNVEIVRTIVTLAHSLGMEVMAEGVETAEQLAQLRSLDCDSAQGWFFSRSLGGDAAGALIRETPTW